MNRHRFLSDTVRRSLGLFFQFTKQMKNMAAFIGAREHILHDEKNKKIKKLEGNHHSKRIAVGNISFSGDVGIDIACLDLVGSSQQSGNVSSMHQRRTSASVDPSLTTQGDL